MPKNGRARGRISAGGRNRQKKVLPGLTAIDLRLIYRSPGPRRRALLPGAKQTSQRVHTTSTHVDAPVDALVVVC